MESTKMVKKVATFMRLEKPSNSLPYIIFVGLTILTLFGIFDACMKEKDNDKFAMGISLFLSIGFLGFSGMREFYSPKRMMKLIRLIEDDFFGTKNDFPGRAHYWGKIDELKKKH